MNTLYPAMITPDETGYMIQFVDIPGAISCGATTEECLFNGAEALSGVLMSDIEHGHDIPHPSEKVEDAYYIAPDVKVQSALLIKWARGDRSMAEIARALETSWPAAQRLEDPHHWATLKQLDKAAAALGKKLILSME